MTLTTQFVPAHIFVRSELQPGLAIQPPSFHDYVISEDFDPYLSDKIVESGIADKLFEFLRKNKVKDAMFDPLDRTPNQYGYRVGVLCRGSRIDDFVILIQEKPTDDLQIEPKFYLPVLINKRTNQVGGIIDVNDRTQYPRQSDDGKRVYLTTDQRKKLNSIVARALIEGEIKIVELSTKTSSISLNPDFHR